ncbi:MAG: hypothetical protein MZU84_07410 [Sphingobacterium sp.]|nr:hypothetical protein [Sphingobacterium sp.]
MARSDRSRPRRFRGAAFLGVAEGAAGVYTQPSSNPYLFERDRSIQPEITNHPDIRRPDPPGLSNGALHWIVWFEMPLAEAGEELGHNFLHLGYSDEYVVDDVLFQTYYRTKDQTRAFLPMPTIKRMRRYSSCRPPGRRYGFTRSKSSASWF